MINSLHFKHSIISIRYIRRYKQICKFRRFMLTRYWLIVQIDVVCFNWLNYYISSIFNIRLVETETIDHISNQFNFIWIICVQQWLDFEWKARAYSLVDFVKLQSSWTRWMSKCHHRPYFNCIQSVYILIVCHVLNVDKGHMSLNCGHYLVLWLTFDWKAHFEMKKSSDVPKNKEI